MRKSTTLVIGVAAFCIALAAITEYLHKDNKVADVNSEEAIESMNKSITVNLYYTGEGDSARLFMEEMESSGTAGLIRAEEGNLRYDYFISAADPETILLIDSWESQEALDRHHESPMMQTIADLREKYNLHMRAERYIPDADGIPSSDQKFLRK